MELDTILDRKKATKYTWGTQFFQFIYFFVASILAASFLSAKDYNTLLILFLILSISLIFEFGLAQNTNRLFSRVYSKKRSNSGDKKLKATYLALVIIYNIPHVIIAVIFTTLLIQFYELEEAFIAPMAIKISLQITFIVLSNVLFGLKYILTVRKIELITTCLKIIMTLAVLPINSVIYIIFVDVVITTLGVVAIIITIKNKEFYYQYINKEKLKKLISCTCSPIYKLGILQSIGFILNYSGAIFISKINDIDVVNQYLLTARIVLYIRIVSQTIIYTNLTYYYDLYSNKMFSKAIAMFASDFRKIVVIFLSLTGATYLVYVFNNSFNIIEFEILEPKLYVVLIVMILIEMHHAAHSQLFLGTGKNPFVVFSALSGIILVITLSYIIKYDNIMYVIITQGIIQLLYNNWYPVYINLKYTKITFKEYVCMLISRKL